MGAMDGAEGIGDIKLRHIRQFLCEFRVILLLTGIEAQVLQ